MSAQDPEQRVRAEPLFGWGTLIVLFAWGVVVLAFSVGGLADVTRFWWLVPLFGAAAPVALVAARGRVLRRNAVDGAAGTERELLDVVRERGELTARRAAMLTPLTATEAAEALEWLARDGYLEASVRDGTLVYALRERSTLSEPPPERTEQYDTAEPKPVELLAEPLSDRELTVLGLLADGLTNKEIAQQLFIAQGTVKAHVASVYRKLEVHSRAEAVSRAKDLALLG